MHTAVIITTSAMFVGLNLVTSAWVIYGLLYGICSLLVFKPFFLNSTNVTIDFKEKSIRNVIQFYRSNQCYLLEAELVACLKFNTCLPICSFLFYV